MTGIAASRGRVFAGAEALGAVDAVVSAEKVAGDAGDSGEGSGFWAEELDGHQAGGDGSVGGSGEDCCETHGC